MFDVAENSRMFRTPFGEESFEFVPPDGTPRVTPIAARQEIALATLPDLYCINCVATFGLGVQRFDLQKACARHPFLEMDSRRFSAALLRVTVPAATILIFESGNGVCTGPTTPNDALLAVRSAVQWMRIGGSDVVLRHFKVENMVVSANLGRYVDLEELALASGAKAHYEPLVFPGLVFRVSPGRKDIHNNDNAREQDRRAPGPPKTRIVINVFHTGKAIVTGGKHVNEILQVYRWFYAHVVGSMYRRHGATTSAQYCMEKQLLSRTEPLQRYIDSIAATVADEDDAACETRVRLPAIELLAPSPEPDSAEARQPKRRKRGKGASESDAAGPHAYAPTPPLRECRLDFDYEPRLRWHRARARERGA